MEAAEKFFWRMIIKPGTSVADANEGFGLVERKNENRKQKSSKTWAQAVQSKGKKIKTTAKFWTTIGQSPETKVPYKADS